MRKRRQKRHNLILIICAFLIVVTVFVSVVIKIKSIVYTYAKSCAETVFLNAANNAVVRIIENGDIGYSDIAVLSKTADGHITSLEINTEKINLLKSLISNEISDEISKKEDFSVAIPIGSFLKNEYTTGLGPKLKFKMQVTSTAFVDFESNFYGTGINQVLHQILIKIKISGNILMTGYTAGFSAETSAIVAQTVIVGLTPEAFTNVIEGSGGGSIVGDIFDYGYVEYDSNGE